MNPSRDPAESNAASEAADFIYDLDLPEDVAKEILQAALTVTGSTLPKLYVPVVLNLCAGVVAEHWSATQDNSRGAQEAIARIFAYVTTYKNPILALECIPVVFSLPIGNGESETSIGRRHGLGRAAVSALCVKMKEHFGVIPGRGMRSEKANGVYSDRQRGKVAKPRPLPWGWAGFGARLKGG
jgi:hypothetical protein